MTLGFAAGKVWSRNRTGLTAKRLMKIPKMERQHRDRWLGLNDSIWDKWTRNKVNVKILIWIILLRQLYLSDKFWNNCPKKAAATSTLQKGVKASQYIRNERKKLHYWYSYRRLTALKPASFLPLKTDWGTLSPVRFWQQHDSSSVKAKHLFHSKMSSAN